MKVWKKGVSLLLSILMVLTLMTVGIVPATLSASAASWNGYNNGGGTLHGSQSFLEAFGIDYDEYMHWMDTHDADSANPHYYLGTPYAHNDHRNPQGDCSGARGAYDTPGVAAMNCTGFVWHVLYKSAVASGAPSYKINRLSVMAGVPQSWTYYDVNRIWFDSVDDAYASGVLEKGDLMWLYGTGDNHNAIFYGDSPKDWIYWDSAGERNRYCEVHAIGESRGLWVAKVTQPNRIELQIDTPSGGKGTKFGTKYMVFSSKEKAQDALNHPDSDYYWDQREGTIVLDSNGHGCFRKQSAPSASELWSGNTPRTNHSYFKSDAKRVNSQNTYYAVQWSHGSGISEDTTIHTFTDSGKRTPSGYRIYRFYAPIHVDTPKFDSIDSTSDGVLMKWSAVKDAYKYRIYYKNRNNEWTRMAETASTSYLDKDVKNGSSYTYTIRCVDRYGNLISDYDTNGTKHTYRILDTPEFTRLESTPEGVKLTWNAVKNTLSDADTRYRVYYKSAKYGWKMMQETTDTTFTDTDITKNGTYTYTIRCVDEKGNFVSKYNTTGWKYTYSGVNTPQITQTVSEPEGIRLHWDTSDNVHAYRIYRQSSDGWQRIAETSTDEYLDMDLTPGETYTYTIRCVNSKGKFVSDFNTNGWRVKYNGIDTPQITEIIAQNDGVNMTWDAVENAVKYRVYRKTPGKGWTRIAELSDTAYFDGDIEENTDYLYTIRCVNDKGGFMSGFNKDGWKVHYQGVDTPQITEITAQNDGVSMTWDAVENAVSYRVYRKLPGGSWTRIAQLSDTSYFDGNITQNTDYLYTVRCVNEQGGFMSGYNKDGWKISYKGVDTPQIAEIGSNADGIRFTWEPVEGAVNYRVYRKTPGQGWTRIAEQTDTEYLDIDCQLNTAYIYTVRCVNEQGGFMSDYNKDGWKATYSGVENPAFTEVKNEPEGIRLTWDAIDGVTAYRVYARGANGWDRLIETKDTTFFDDKIPFGTTRRYTIRAINDHGDFASDFNEQGWTITYTGVDTPQITSLESTADGVRITWDPVEGAVQYRVFYKGADGWERLAVTEGTEFVDISAQAGSTYIYTVRCLGSKDNYISDYDHTGGKIEYQPPVEPEPTESPE
ncbi:hypothetical protein [uncultured Ruminococcus sp.]|uniref:hypothetical protein n=1 Tax=uncultured Ruminococcus sp. TaxID=165186 RepID=UPI00292DBDCB|nr:hypothetical protein [uncultured Ruminococcus sp.]